MNNEYLTVYFITVFEKVVKEEPGWPYFGASRVWGFYSNRDVAVRALHENWTDMHETVYDYAVIEGYDEGISHAHDPAEAQWFKWDEDRHGYFEIERPEAVVGFGSWSLG